MASESKTRFRLAPLWAWLFFAACVAIPAVSLGGAIPGAIGFGGGGACLAVAADNSKAVKLRVVTCAGITLGCWLSFGVVMVAFTALRG